MNYQHYNTPEMQYLHVVACLKRNEKITASDLKTLVKVWLKPDSNACNVIKPSEKKFTNVNSPTDKKEEKTPVSTIQDDDGYIDTRPLVSPSALPGYEEKPLPPALPPDAPIADKLKRDNELLNAHISQAEQYRIKQKAVHEEMDRLAVAFTELLTQGRKNILNDFKEEHKEYTTLADVFIHMIDMLAEKKGK